MTEDAAPLRPGLQRACLLGRSAWLLPSVFVPSLVAASQLDLYGSGGRDAEIVRTAGLGYAGGFHALDAWVAASFAAVPLGTRVLRAELPGVFLLAATAALMFVLVRRALVARAGPSGWSAVVAAIATLMVTLSYAFLREASSAGGSLTGVVLVLVALVSCKDASPALRAGLVILGLSYEPPVGACVAVTVLLSILDERPPPDATVRGRRLSSAGALAAVVGGALGLVPFALASVRAHVSLLSTSARLFASPLGETSGAGVRRAAELVLGELGEVFLVVAGVGVVWGLASRKPRPVIAPLAAVTLAASILFLCGSGTRDAWTSVGLVAVVGTGAFAAIAMQEAVLRVARARLPLASASAAMIVVLEAAFPATQLDDGLARASGRPTHALAAWEDTALRGLPSGTLILVSAPRLYARLLATSASGDLPGDLGVLPTFDPANEASASALAADARLVPLFRDIALVGVPQELSLSTLATARPVVLAADPRWDRNLARHLLPAGLLALFEPEPRGGSDRKRALEDSQAWRAALAKDLGAPPDAALLALTTAILLDRAIAAAETGEREVAIHALDDASAFSPKDPRIEQLALRVTRGHGPVDVHDLLHLGLAGP